MALQLYIQITHIQTSNPLGISNNHQLFGFLNCGRGNFKDINVGSYRDSLYVYIDVLYFIYIKYKTSHTQGAGVFQFEQFDSSLSVGEVEGQ